MKLLLTALATLLTLFLHAQDHPDSEIDAKRSSSQPFSVITPNVGSLPWTFDGDVKVYHLVAEPVRREFAPGFWVNCWGYNGTSPGPTIETVEGDRVRIYVTNRLTEPTTVHWHGIILPNGMDGVSGLTQPSIKPGETYQYEFTLKQNGTFMYHPHADEMTQVSMGMEGFFIIHPKEGDPVPVDRDFAIMLHEWNVPQGAETPIPFQSEYNLFTFNNALFPIIEPLVAKTNQRVRVRFGNLMMNSHPIHLHGYEFTVTRRGGGRVPVSAQYTQVTVSVAPGETRDIEFIADNPGDWAFHCHKPHHTMNQMAHDLANLTGIEQTGIDQRLRKFFPGLMGLMGVNGMGSMFELYGSRNRPPHAASINIPPNLSPIGGPGPHDVIEMGGMFTVVKVRDGITSYEDPGWYEQPPGTSAELVTDFPDAYNYAPNIHSPSSSPSKSSASWFSEEQRQRSPHYQAGTDWMQSEPDRMDH
jgi:plastocyanin